MEKLQVVNLYHEQWLGMTLPWEHFRVQAAKKSIQRAHVGTGGWPRVRRPLTWELIPVLEVTPQSGGGGSRIAWIGLLI